jgi:predicted ATP-dependent endonuclease of OLD family
MEYSLNSLEVEHFKGFYEKEKIEFAIPDNINKGSGLTIITGQNNAGKSTLLETLLINKHDRLEKSARHLIKKPVIKINSNDNFQRNQIFTVTNHGNGANIKSSGEKTYIDYIPSRRHWDQHFSTDSDLNYLRTSGQYRRENQNNVALAQLLSFISKNKNYYQSFIDNMREIMPNFLGFDQDADFGKMFIVLKVSNDLSHQINYTGDGIITLFRIIAHFFGILNEETNEIEITNHPLIIDEPELSLQPQTCKRLAEFLREKAKTKQIIIATHSPYFINWKDLQNGAKFYRLNKVAEKCVIKSVNSDSNYFKKILKDGNWNTPFLFDTVGKEIFFYDKVLFVEGQEDAGLINKWFDDNGIEKDFEVFGYGVRGYTNFKNFFDFCLDIGITRAACLFDKGNNEIIEFNKLKDKENYTNFGIFQHNKSDIRDKDGYYKMDENGESGEKIDPKNGYFNRKGKLKAECKKDWKNQMDLIKEYFKND